MLSAGRCRCHSTTIALPRSGWSGHCPQGRSRQLRGGHQPPAPRGGAGAHWHRQPPGGGIGAVLGVRPLPSSSSERRWRTASNAVSVATHRARDRRSARISWARSDANLAFVRSLCGGVCNDDCAQVIERGAGRRRTLSLLVALGGVDGAACRGSGRCDGGTVDVRHRFRIVRGCAVGGVGGRSLCARKGGRRSSGRGWRGRTHWGYAVFPVAGCLALPPLGETFVFRWGAACGARWPEGAAGRGWSLLSSSCCVPARVADGAGSPPGQRRSPRWSTRLPSLWCD